MYFLFGSSYNQNHLNFDDRVDIYINNVENLGELLYQNGVIQDKKSFEEFLKSKKVNKQHFITGRKVSFKKAMSYEEIFDIVYKKE
ncbi:hypothetical protein [Caldicellulosiruptor morganii]|uniref:Uncharacterized protein n=1 Tax=Caldicellulosiruptor morganii TaxID=1387555 RepID=A0ABY7BNF5_9FIRM|nr:hypothetical protein [Caldicellulosiruptor morganii]WAM33422.1 hypothetical protein OTK00_001921 [Caldicellulosiruptor morganii]